MLISELPTTDGHELWSVTDLQTHQRCEMELYPAVALTVAAWFAGRRFRIAAADPNTPPDEVRRPRVVFVALNLMARSEVRRRAQGGR